MADFFIADTHFGSPYRSYAKPRGFASVEAMHLAIVSGWRSRVVDEDTVWVLGDVGDLSIVADLPGTKHLIFGNDDKPKGPFKESKLFASCQTSHLFKCEGGPILLIHAPNAAKLDGVKVLHGHTHGGPDETDPRFVSVSVDKTGWGPIRLDEVIKRFKERVTALSLG